MFSGRILIFLIIFSSIVNSEEKKLPECEEQVFDHAFAYFFNELAWKMWLAAMSNAPQEENFIFYPYNFYRLFAILHAATGNPTRAKLESIQKFNHTLHFIERYVHCLTTQRFHKIFQVKEMAYFGLQLAPGVRRDYTLLARYNFGLDFYERKPFELPDGVINKLDKDTKTITNEKIDKFFFDIMKSGMDEGFLYGGHYLKTVWKKPFDENNTETDDFIVTPPNKKIKAKIMKIRALFPRSDPNYKGAQFVELLFKDRRFSMIVIVPKERKSLKSVIKSMKDHGVYYIMQKPISRKNVTLRFPKFKIDKRPPIELMPILKDNELGLGSLVDKYRSMFLCMSPRDLYINSTKQGTFMEINEEKLESAVIINHLFYTKSKRLLSENKADDRQDDHTPPNLTPEKPELADCYFCIYDCKKMRPVIPDIESVVPGGPPVEVPNSQKADDLDSDYEDNSSSGENQNEEARHGRARELEINATKPFMFAIVDRDAQIPLIFGKISKPLEK